MAKKLHVDIETYSSVDIKTSGAYKYTESIDFEILMIAYALGEGEIKVVDLAQGEEIPQEFLDAMLDPAVEKWAHNAIFERRSFIQYGIEVPINQWHCSAVKAAYCSLPLSLEKVSEALKLEDKGKSATGKALIKYFSIPCKPTKVNGMRERNYPKDDIDKWGMFKEYCKQDVEAERAICEILSKYSIPENERLNYILDQEINDRGIKVDTDFAINAVKIDGIHSEILKNRIKKLTGVDNPGSVAQLKEWLSNASGKRITSLAKDKVSALLEDIKNDAVREVLELRQKTSKSSTKKYEAMPKCACEDGRVRGLLQFYGANRTGRWAGRLIQLHNLPQNHLSDLELARDTVANGDYETASLMYDDISSTLSQLIRTALVAEEGKTFAVADFSAIEARVIAWLANEKWRLDVFRTHGKIYEASASMMFNIPIENVTKGSDYRAKGKVAELALGYQGGVGALKQMGGEAMGLGEDEMSHIVGVWRGANKNIVKLWNVIEAYVAHTLKTKEPVVFRKGILVFEYDGTAMTIQLPSGRKLFYWKPGFTINRFGSTSIKYQGVDQQTKKWGYVESYGGKFTENIVQAIARDLLVEAMKNLDKNGFPIVMHVHDEAICEIPIQNADISLEKMCHIMGQEISWAKNLPLNADGYLTPFYKKD